LSDTAHAGDQSQIMCEGSTLQLGRRSAFILLIQQNGADRKWNFNLFRSVSVMKSFDKFMFDQVLIRKFFTPENH
jgi:hypothetical protein